jgi:diguanylate cyclase (GGDEF)-like protein
MIEGACALSGAAAAFLYVKEETTWRLVGCSAGPDDPRRKGLLQVSLDEVLAVAGYAGGGAEIGQAPALFGAFAFEAMVVLSGGEKDLTCRMLLGLGAGPAEGTATAVSSGLRFFTETLPALANGYRVERIRELVIKDDQTESYNRRYLESFLGEEVVRARRYGTALSVIFLDLDDLKSVNNQHGHAAGSRALREFSRRVIGAIRGSDKLFRYGGDEFCVVLPETDAMGAFELAERLRQTVAARPFALGEDDEVPLTASFGIASFPQHADSAASLLACADQAMTRVKQAGKNSIGVGGGSPSRTEPLRDAPPGGP